MKGISRLRTSINRHINGKDLTLVYVLLGILAVYVLIHDFLGGTLFEHNAWDSYTLQTMAWREGRLHLGRNYEYLELAIFKGRYYVSFPPVPSVLMLPWTWIYEYKTPNNIIMIIYVMITIILAYLCARHFKLRPASSAFLSVFFVLGSNMFWMSTMGGVWFQAQLIGMMLAVLSILAMLKNKRVISYGALALAVGCRPFYIFYFPVLFAAFYMRSGADRKKSADAGCRLVDQGDSMSFPARLKDCKKDGKSRIREIGANILDQGYGILTAGFIGCGYMAYNLARFDDPLEFGHNYLPEFTESEYGQFSLVYLKENLHNIFFRGIEFDDNMRMEIPIFNGFRFYIANPMFLVLFALTVFAVIKRTYKLVRWFAAGKLKKASEDLNETKVMETQEDVKISDILNGELLIGILIYAGLILNTLALCVHKTFGGWQFGCRYMCDALAFAYLFILMAHKERDRLYGFEIFLGIFAVAFNAYGIVYMNMP